MNYEALEELLTIKATAVPLTQLCIHETLQPRIAQLLPARHSYGVLSRSWEHTDSLLLKLQGSKQLQLEPILVAEIGKEQPLPPGLYVIDGHHRLAAYSAALREEIPARVSQLNYNDAIMASKMANCSHRAMKMHEEQRLDAAWQWLVIATEGAKKPLPKDASARKLAALFDIGKNTAQRMKKRLREIDPDDYDVATLAPETGWPRWKFTREHRDSWQKHLAKLLPAERTEQEARMFLGRYIELFDKVSPEARTHAKVLLETDALYEEDRQKADLDYLLSFYR